ncbi:hypothetical protein pEaSNUABM13_00140 [Erwinia phage pEa_SNUABM_13]|nr:hypothetical protein pEaSNUABM13_00140 [Erwinia phage pEa_SNUABM_13]QYW03440.1 hypothetical protein pEaSNUABM34_00138 [Erwinia phage pEa_SNUABM_34]QYW04123.1 hypothetical protein pEaSNUABM46_00139 [Erwinia phage pEa_SNUABM_46]QYW05153.1 hypothetical protein pEaSNUABM21_00139 [Erwinia phage pEa_SNUABM_21]QYW05495.1 hypothetical protein pEaSNUABM25_00139 [Erwinia phage pEa_SNUABM_25]
MPLPTLADLQDTSAPGLDDPFMLDKWRIREFPTMGGVSLSPFACEEVDLPFSVFQSKSKEVASVAINWPHGSSIDGFNLMFGIDQRLAVMKYFTAWQNLIQNPYTGGMRLPSAYKKNMFIELYDNQGKMVAAMQLRNCWPVGGQGIQLNGTGGRGVWSVQMQLDAQIPEFS